MNRSPKFTTFILITAFILFSGSKILAQIDQSYYEKQKKAYTVSSENECQTSLNFCTEVLKVVPNHPIINYLAARLHAMLGHKKGALDHLEIAIKMGYTTKLPFKKIHHLNDSAFKSYYDDNRFIKMAGILEQAEQAVQQSKVAFLISDKELAPEGIAYDPVDKIFYLGSETKSKIITLDQSGNTADFTTEKQDGLNIVLGIHVDPVRRHLWSCSYEENKQAIFKYDLLTKKLIKKYVWPEDGTGTYFNDLVIHSDGNIFITDPQCGGIYTITTSHDKIELFYKTDLLISPNGITLSDNGQDLFVGDTYMGIHKINLKTKFSILLTHEPGFSVYGIDGLYFKNNNLYAIEILMNRVSRFTLNETGDHISSCETIEKNSEFLHKPTTGVIADNYFYFIADTYAKAHNKEGVIIMKTRLK